jgi:hypothetical protein
MICPNCGESFVNVQAINDFELKNKHHGILWWLVVGWWWLPIKWICFTLPAIIIKIFKPKKQKIVTHTHTVCVCQTCGYRWEI